MSCCNLLQGFKRDVNCHPTTSACPALRSGFPPQLLFLSFLCSWTAWWCPVMGACCEDPHLRWASRLLGLAGFLLGEWRDP